MIQLIDVITSEMSEVRDSSLESLCGQWDLEQLLEQTWQLDRFRRHNDNLYHRVRALF